MVIACAVCGLPLPAGARFCPNCGAGVGPLVETEERKMVTVLFATGHATLTHTVLAALPALLTLGFAVFRQAHPPGYDTDLFDLWLHGPGFGPEPPRNLWP